MIISTTEKEFYNNIYLASYGKSLAEVNLEQQDVLLDEVKKLFFDFVANFTKVNYGQRKHYQMQVCLRHKEQNLISKFPNLAEILNKAYESFLNELKSKIYV